MKYYIMAFSIVFALIALIFAIVCIIEIILTRMIELREEKKDTVILLSPTLQWMNIASSILLAVNYANNSECFRYMAGCFFPENENNLQLLQSVKTMLWKYWGIQNHDQAIEQMVLVLQRGMREDYGKEMKNLENIYYNYSEKDLIELEKKRKPNATEDSFLPKMLMAYRRYGENALLGWDVGRVAYIMQCCYLVGYVSMEELLDVSVEAGKKAQECFTNWEEMTESYLLGGQYWQREDADNPNSLTAERWKLYETLWKGKKPYTKIPYLMIDFHTPLSKEMLTDKYGIMPEYQKYHT